MPVMSPADFLGLEVPDLFLGGNGRMDIILPGPHWFVLRQRLRRQRRCLGGHGQRGGSGGNSNGNFKKMTALHGHLPVGKSDVTQREFDYAEMNGR